MIITYPSSLIEDYDRELYEPLSSFNPNCEQFEFLEEEQRNSAVNVKNQNSLKNIGRFFCVFSFEKKD